MSNEKPPASALPRILRVQFRDPVQIGVGDFAEITAWSADKHAKHIECAEKGNWIVLTVKEMRFRIPMTNVVYVREGLS